MDPISYGVAAKQKQRIEKIIAEPDSTSGVITVPQVIATGETITVPAGRTAVLPNVQVDGELVVDGEVFIPSGSGLSTVVQKSGDTMSGNLNFASGTKITGDFSNGSWANRLSIQNNTSNTFTSVQVLPNGTATSASFRVFNSSDPDNSSFNELTCTATYSRIGSGTKGTGTALPLVIHTGGAEKMIIDTSGNVLVTGAGAFGYGTGSGGTVTQLTSKSTAVTLNKPTGQITMNNAALAAGASVVFQVNCSVCSHYDVPIATGAWTVVIPENYRIEATKINYPGGVFFIKVTNVSGVSLSEALTINFAIIKGANV